MGQKPGNSPGGIKKTTLDDQAISSTNKSVLFIELFIYSNSLLLAN